MRETFGSLWELLGCYRTVKESVTAMPSLVPKRDYEQISRKLASKLAQSRMEDKFALIADVELFVKWFYIYQRSIKPIPESCLFDIFHLRFCANISKFQSYGHLALHYKKRKEKGEDLPARLLYKQHLWGVAKKMEKSIEAYYSHKGFFASEGSAVT